MTTFPVSLYHPAAFDPAEQERFIRMTLERLKGKTITAHSQAELESLMRIGWKPVEDAK